MQNLKPSLEKSYIKHQRRIEEYKKYPELPSKLWGETTKIKSMKMHEINREFLQSKDIYFSLIEHSKLIYSLDRLEFMREIYLEINEALLHLKKLRKTDKYITISRKIRDYSINILKKISDQFWNQFKTKFPIPKFNFIDDSIEIRWEKDKFKLIIRTSDYIDDFSVYQEDKTGQSIHGNVRKERIVDWVIFWLRQFQIS